MVARNPALVAEALRRIGALEGGKLPVFGSGDSVQPVQIVSDLSRQVAIEPFEVRGYYGRRINPTGPVADNWAIRPIGGFGLVIENWSCSVESNPAWGTRPIIIIATLSSTAPWLGLPDDRAWTGSGEPKAWVQSSGGLALPSEGTAEIPYVNRDPTGATTSVYVEGPSRWYVPPGAEFIIQVQNFGAVTGEITVAIDWREVPAL